MARVMWIMGGDLRSYWAASYLTEHGIQVHTHGIPGFADEPLPKSFQEVILPFPSFQGALLKGSSAIPVEELLCRVESGTVVYGGLMGPWQEAIKERGGFVVDLYDTEPLTTANAALTAEGAVALAIEQAPFALQHARCLVIGYGRIGKTLAQKLQALSACVTVAARSPKDRALAEAFCHKSDETGIYRKGLDYDFVFNTVPFPVFDRKQLDLLPSRCFVIELASQPGGIAQEDREKLRQNYISAPGLPGRFSPASAGALYANSILKFSSKGG